MGGRVGGHARLSLGANRPSAGAWEPLRLRVTWCNNSLRFARRISWGYHTVKGTAVLLGIPVARLIQNVLIHPRGWVPPAIAGYTILYILRSVEQISH